MVSCVTTGNVIYTNFLYMSDELYPYQIKALRQLAAYKKVLSADRTTSISDKEQGYALQDSIITFTEMFCQQNLANTDYTILQERQYRSDKIEDWINEMDIDIILQCITYVIWTNKSIDGYFVSKVRDGFIEKLLHRLEKILSHIELAPQLA